MKLLISYIDYCSYTSIFIFVIFINKLVESQWSLNRCLLVYLFKIPNPKVDQTRKQRRELEAKRLADKIKMEKKAALEAKRQHEELLNGKQKKIILLSEKSKRIHPDLYPKKRKTWGKKKPPPKPVLLSTESVKEAAKKPENSDKV